MRVYWKAFLCVSLTILLCAAQPAVYATEDAVKVKVAMSEDESIIVERIVYTALNHLGIQMVTKTAGMRTTINDVNYGEAAIVPAQAIGLEVEFPNLIRVPVPISHVETNAYTRSDESYQFSAWSDLSGLRLSHCWKNAYITRNVPRANASEVVTLNEYEDLWRSLLAGETDVAVIPNLTGYVRVVPVGVKMAGVIEREPRYTYVNKDYEYLVPLLTEAYQQMTDDGTMEMIRNSQQTGTKKVVLHVSSYSQLLKWERDETDAIRKSLEAVPHLEYHNLNLRARQIPNRANMNAIIANTIRTNFIERNPDLIIATDNDALEFVLNNYYMLFPKVPVVFCGINDFDSNMLHGFEEYFTGVSEDASPLETIEEMLRLYPQTKRVFILNDYTPSGLKWRDSLQKSIDANSLPVVCEFNENKPFAELLDEIRGFDNDTLVLLGTYFLDSEKAFYVESQVQEQVSAASKTPVFCLASSFNGSGSLGGYVTAADLQGAAAGTMAVDILNGMKPSEIPILINSTLLNRWQFDYAVAAQFGIRTKSLPAGHTVINQTLAIWESNPFEFWLALVTIGASMVIIVGLVVFIRMMRRKNARLLEIQSHLHSAEELHAKDTELKKALSLAAQKEREANQAKSAFLSRMSHEIRTPLNAITGMTAIAKASDSHEKITNSLEKIDNASKHLLGVINDILDMAKIESGKLELNYAPIDVHEMIENIVSIIRFRMESKGQTLAITVGDDVPPYIVGDELHLSQVVTNLLSNAIKFTPESGKIALSVTMRDEQTDPYTLQFSVEDNGIGVPAEQQSRIFAAFEQASGSISRAYGGTGLGLSISKQLVELMDGEIWVQSEMERGSTFAFTIKAQACDAPTHEENKEGKPVKTNAFTGQTILLADDVEVNREIVTAVLEDTGAAIIPAENGLTAVTLFQDDPKLYNLILMDIHMPEMDGYEATRRIRALACDEAKRIPIIAMTADVFQEDIALCLEAGMNDHIGKPVNVDELLKRLGKYLNRTDRVS